LVSEQLSSGVRHIYPAMAAFAAVKEDGSVVVWGNQEYGGANSEACAVLQGSSAVAA